MRVLLLGLATRVDIDELAYGIVYVSGALLHGGHEVKPIDLTADKKADDELCYIIEEYKPDVIGFSGITTAYHNLKRLSKLFNERYPHIVQIAGGVISCVDYLILKNTHVSIVCRGEGETTVNKLMTCLENKDNLNTVPGISYIEENEIQRTDSEKYIEDLDTLPFPPYHLFDINKYVNTKEKYLKWFQNDTRYDSIPKNKRRVFNIKISRGCVGTCTFCYRHLHGYRRHSPEYVTDLMKFLYEKYDISLFIFGDELFVFNEVWIDKFLDCIKNKNLKVLFRINGARVDDAAEHLILKLKSAGCVAINFGFESGSQKMLDVMKKRVKVEKNYNVIDILKRTGIASYPYIIIGMPGEDNDTIKENINFVVHWGKPSKISFSIAQAFPKTWLWKYAIDNKLIEDEEKYILEYRDNTFINFTNEKDWVVKSWQSKIFHKASAKIALSEGKYLVAIAHEIMLVIRLAYCFLKDKLSNRKKEI